MGGILKFKKSIRAFTLIEIMIALIIFTVGIISIMSLFPLSLKSALRARIVTQATFLAQARLEEELSEPAMTMPDNSSGTFEPDFPNFVYVIRKSDFNDNPAITKIEVYVFHPINDRKQPLAHLTALKCTQGAIKPRSGDDLF